MGWWPGSSSGGLVGIGMSDANWASYYTQASMLIYSLGTPLALGVWSLRSGITDVPSIVSYGDSSITKAAAGVPINNASEALQLVRPVNFDIVSDYESLSSHPQSSSIFNAATQSITNLSFRYAAFSDGAQNLKEYFLTSADFPQTSGFCLYFSSSPYLSGVTLQYYCTQISSGIVYSNPITGNSFSINDIWAAYMDAWNEAMRYRSSTLMEKNAKFFDPSTDATEAQISSSSNEIYAYYPPFSPFQLIAFVDKTQNSTFSGIIEAQKNDASSILKINSIPSASGLSLSDNRLIWDDTEALKYEIKSDLWDWDGWVHWGLDFSDRLSSNESHVNSNARAMGISWSSGSNIKSYSGVFEDGGVSNNRSCKIKSISVVPSYMVFPELYQCLSRTGPVWDWVNLNIPATGASQRRLEARDLILRYPISTLLFEKIILHDGDTRSAIPSHLAPYSAIQYYARFDDEIQTSTFQTSPDSFIMNYNATAIIPAGGSGVSVSDHIPTIYVKVWHPLKWDQGFAHGIDARTLWMGIPIAAVSGAAAGASGGITGALSGAGIGIILSDNAISISYIGLLTGLSSLAERLIFNPRPTNQYVTCSFHFADSVLVNSGEWLFGTEIKKVSSINGYAALWGSVAEANNLGTWAIGDSFFNNGSTHFFGRGMLTIKFRAKANTNTMSFLEFRLYMVPRSSFVPSDVYDASLSQELSFQNSKFIDDNFSNFELCFSTQLSNGSATSAGRRGFWAYGGSSYDIKTLREDGIEGAWTQSAIFSDLLTDAMQDYEVQFFIDSFDVDSNNPYFKDNLTDFRAHQCIDIDSVGGVSLWLNVRAWYSYEEDVLEEPPIVTLSVEGTNFTVTTPIGKIESYQSSYIQIPIANRMETAGGALDYEISNLSTFVNPRVSEKIYSTITKSSQRPRYYSALTSNPDYGQFITLLPPTLLSNLTQGLESWYIGCSIYPGDELSSLISTPSGRASLLESFGTGSVSGSGDSSVFISHPGIADTIYIDGNINKYYNIKCYIGEIVLESNSLSPSLMVCMGSLEFLESDGTIHLLGPPSIFQATMGSGVIEFNIGPIISKLTILNSGWIILRLKLLIGANSNISGSGLIQIYKIDLSSNNGIGRIIPGDRISGAKGKTLEWFRGLPAEGSGLTRGTDTVTIIVDKASQLGMVTDSNSMTATGVVFGPPIYTNLTEDIGYVLEYSSTSNWISEVRVELLTAGRAVSGANAKVVSASQNFGDMTTYIARSHINSNEILLDTASSLVGPRGEHVIMNVNDVPVVGTSATVSTIQKVYTSAGREMDSPLIIYLVEDSITDVNHPTISSFVRIGQQDIRIWSDTLGSTVYELDGEHSPIIVRDLQYVAATQQSEGDGYMAVARHVSGCYVMFKMSLNGALIPPLYYIEGRYPSTSDQTDLDPGKIGNTMLISNWPFVTCASTFYDATGASSVPIGWGAKMKGSPPALRDGSGNIISHGIVFGSNFGNYVDGIEVAQGHPALIRDDSGGYYLIYSYSSLFNGAKCSPLTGRVYAMYTGNNGVTWTPPVCVFSLSPFGPDLNNSSKFSQFLSNNGGISGGNVTSSNWINGSLYTGVFGSIYADIKTQEDVLSISIELIDAAQNYSTGEYILSFWFGGYICYTDIGQNLSILKEMWSTMCRSGLPEYNSVGYPWDSPQYNSIYSATTSNGYLYTYRFWEPAFRSSIFVASGDLNALELGSGLPAQLLIGYGKLVQYVEPQAWKTTGNIYERDSNGFIEHYDTTWDKWIPNKIYIKFSDIAFSQPQPRQKCAITFHESCGLAVYFMDEDNKLCYIPCFTDSDIKASGFPREIDYTQY